MVGRAGARARASVSPRASVTDATAARERRHYVAVANGRN